MTLKRRRDKVLVANLGEPSGQPPLLAAKKNAGVPLTSLRAGPSTSQGLHFIKSLRGFRMTKLDRRVAKRAESLGQLPFSG
jgi:hypothetical protein